MQYAKWDAAVKPVSKPLRFFDEHGKACCVPTDGLCYIGFKPGRSKVHRGPTYESNHQPGYSATNGYTRGNSTNVSNKDSAEYETAHGNVHRPQSDFLSAKRELDTTGVTTTKGEQIVREKFLEKYKLSSDYQKNRFHKLAIECRVAQVAANKGIKISQDGTVYSEFLTQVQSKPGVWQGVLHAQKSLPTEC
jgi:hypothetical protein